MKPHLFTKKSIFHIFSTLFVVISMLVQVTPARAATLTVSSILDDGGVGTLRTVYGKASPGDTINFSSGLSGQTITLNSTLSIAKNVTIDGSLLAVPITITGSFAKVFSVTGAVTDATLNRLKITSNQSSTNGGAISNAGTLKVTNSILSGNNVVAGGSGGAISNTGTLTVINSTISGNNATGQGGAIYNTGTLTVQNSTFSANSTSGNGGGISNTGTLTVTNSTFSGNIANGSGGGIYNNGSLTVKNSTLSENSSSSWGGGIFQNAGTLDYANTIIANSTNYDCYLGGGTVTNTKNLVENNAPGTNACGVIAVALATDPMLGSLADNAVTVVPPQPQPITQTMALLEGSPAIDTGDATTCNAAIPGPNKLDQRGVTRPQGTKCDIGAYESVMYKLTVIRQPVAGTDVVISAPAGINCGAVASCSKDFLSGTSVTLTAAPASGFILNSWIVSVGGVIVVGACPGAGTTCTVTMNAATSVTAIFVPGFELTVVPVGSGIVTSFPTGIDCGITCKSPFSINTPVTLTATPAAGSIFSNWTGDCTGTGTCQVTMNAAHSVTANFTVIPTYALTVVKPGVGNGSGNGTGNVTSSPAGIDCGATCAFAFTSGTSVTLTAVADPGSSFGGWNGACTGTGPCTVTMNSIQAVAATFNASSSSTYTMTVTKSGMGAGTVSSNPAGIDCGVTCSFAFNSGTAVTLTATAGAGSTFTGWSGEGCSGTGTCVVAMSAARSVIATFASSSNTLTVVKTGTDAGTVTSSPSGITACSATCSFAFASSVATVTLTATPGAGATFTSWSGGGCSGAALTCVVPMSTAQTVIATFGTSTSFALDIIKPATNTGTGTVTSGATPGIACGSVCLYPFTVGTSVILTAVADPGSTFSGWAVSGVPAATCAGTGTCTVTMNVARTVTATFVSSTTYTLSVSKTGSGTGIVTSSPAGITCGATCSSAFASGTVVTLTAVPDAGIPFGGWSGGGCSGTGTCVVTMSAAQSVTAIFGTSTSFVMNIIRQGTGTGTVISSPAGIICGSTCSFVFTSGTLITLTPSPDAGSSFIGWGGGDCSGTGTCVVTMTGIKSITAIFNTATTYALSVTRVGSGKVTSSPIGIACGLSCSSAFNTGTVVTLTAVPDTGSSFSGWSGAPISDTGCVAGTTGTCVVTMSAAKSVTATFNITTFSDVPITHPQYKHIQALWDGGFTGGCSVEPLMFCPDRILDRAESAVFMLRARLGVHYVPPSVPSHIFVDDWTLFPWAERWAEGMYQAGLTGGCQTDPLKFCPDQKLSRVQASIFGLRIKYGMSYVPPTATGTLFADYPTTDPSYSWGLAWAEKAYLLGLLPACGTDSASGKPKFCPNELVNRSWAAYLIVTAKGLPIP